MVKTYMCGICGNEKQFGEEWFLMAESRWQDRLKILRWHDQLALQSGVSCACSAAHVQELVLHWMTTGSLEYPFARTSLVAQARNKLLSELVQTTDPDISGAQQISELSVHRESIRRVLAENPQSLSSILEALVSALQRHAPPVRPTLEEEEEALCLAGEV